MEMRKFSIYCLTLFFALIFLFNCTLESPEMADMAAVSMDNGQETAFPGKQGVVKTGYAYINGENREITYEVIDGFNVYEGDILIADEDISEKPLARGVVRTDRKWPNSSINFVIRSDVYSSQIIRDAIDHIKANTILRFSEGTASNYIEFIPSSGSSSYIGMQGGRQYVRLASWATMGTAVHEILHALGVEHEHTRADRGSHVIINWNNIQSGKAHNFYINNSSAHKDVGAFNFGSIMLYGSYGFSKNGLPTITRLNGTTFSGQRTALSSTDTQAVFYLYPANDYIWFGNSNKTFSSTYSRVDGTYTPLRGDFNGDGRFDIFWYNPGTGTDYVWYGNANKTFSSKSFTVNGTYKPVTGDFNGDGRWDVFWYKAGTGTDYVWYGNANKTFSSKTFTVNGTYAPVAGDFNGDGEFDIFWYRAGTGADYIWFGNTNKTFSSVTSTVNGTYNPQSGDFNGDGRWDIFWYRAGTGADYVWYGNANKTFSSKAFTVNGTYKPVTGDFNGDGEFDIFWYRAGSSADYVWYGNANKTFSSKTFTVNGTYDPVAGDFNGDGRWDVFWYKAGTN